jgi:hypothetical protein
MSEALLNAICNLSVAFRDAGLRNPVAIVVASQEEADQFLYLFARYATVDDPTVTGTTISGIEMRVEK